MKTALGFESGGTSRLHEQFGYAYDKAWNLNYRTNNALTETFSANVANELTGISRSGTLTVAGFAEASASPSLTVSGTGLSSGAAAVYSDGTWARAGASPANGANSYTASATDSYGRSSQDNVSVTLTSPVNFIYDPNGNLLNDGQRYFSYDDENQLTSVTVSNAWRSEFTYDGLMRRRKRVEYTWSAGTWLKTNEVRYVYDGRLPIQERDANNLPTLTQTRGIALSGTLAEAGGVGGLLARTDAGLLTVGSPSGHAYYHFDGNGNVTCLIDISNAIVARYCYDPFGSSLAKSGSLADANLYRSSSKELHVNSGLSYYLYRHYDPNLQRWLNRDPLEELGGINLYQFVRNRPSDLLDPVGLVEFYPSDFIGPLPEGGVRCPQGPARLNLHDDMMLAESLGFRNTKAGSSGFGREEGGGMSGLAATWVKADWFKSQVQTGGPWDPKNFDHDQRYDPYGNFHYGATGNAYGWSDWELENFAGLANGKGGEGKPGYWPGTGKRPYGDRPLDNYWVRMGIEYARQYPAQKGAGPCN